MKKILCVLFVFSLMLTACSKQIDRSTTTQKTVSTTEIETESSEKENQTTKELTEKDRETVPDTLNAIETSAKTAKTETENVQNSSPMMIYVSLEDLKEIKKAYDTMSDDDFMSYMKAEKTDQYMTGLWDYENAEKLLHELFSTTMPLLDGNPENFSEIVFYWKNNSINQIIMFDDEKSVSVIVYTINSTEPKELQLDDNTVFISEKSIEIKDYTAKIYEVENNYYSFFADIVAEESYIVLRSNYIETMDDFEACVKRLELVKLGDLIDEA